MGWREGALGHDAYGTLIYPLVLGGNHRRLYLEYTVIFVIMCGFPGRSEGGRKEEGRREEGRRDRERVERRRGKWETDK